MAQIEFIVTHRFDVAARVLWDDMIDWPAHADWVPATRVELDSGSGRTVGDTFTGYTGYGPLTLVDRMQVTSLDWDEARSTGTCEVNKLGPVLTGTAGFEVSNDGEGSRLDWFERVKVPYLPQFAAPVAAKLGALGFKLGFRQLAKVLNQRATSRQP